jgi:hypothetical protein
MVNPLWDRISVLKSLKWERKHNWESMMLKVETFFNGALSCEIILNQNYGLTFFINLLFWIETFSAKIKSMRPK